LPADAQRSPIFKDSQDLSLESEDSNAVKESVTQRPRKDFEAEGVTLRELLDLPGRLRTGGAPVGERLVPLEPGRREVRPAGPGESGPGSGATWLNSLVLDMRLKPTVELRSEYDDNLFRAEQTKISDLRNIVAPKLLATSDWTRHQLQLEASGRLGRHLDNTNEDFDDWALRQRLRLDVGRSHEFRFQATEGRGHRDRGEFLLFQTGSRPVTFDYLFGDFDWTYKPDAVSARLRYRYRTFDYHDVGQFDPDVDDVATHDVHFRAGYDIAPGTTVWLEPGHFDTRYTGTSRFGLPDRSAQAAQLLGGLTYNVSDVSFAEAGLGYFRGEPDSAQLEDFSGLAAQLRVVWNVTSLFTLEADGGRFVEEASFFGTAPGLPTYFGSARTATRLSLGAAWDPAENVIVEGKYAYAHEDHIVPDGFGELIRRRHRGEIGVRYLLNPNLHLGLNLRHEDQDSDFALDSYKANVLSFRFSAQL